MSDNNESKDELIIITNENKHLVRLQGVEFNLGPHSVNQTKVVKRKGHPPKSVVVDYEWDEVTLVANGSLVRWYEWGYSNGFHIFRNPEAYRIATGNPTWSFRDGEPTRNPRIVFTPPEPQSKSGKASAGELLAAIRVGLVDTYGEDEVDKRWLDFLSSYNAETNKAKRNLLMSGLMKDLATSVSVYDSRNDG